MGFFAMIGSMILGIFCIVLGFHNRKKHRVNIVFIPLGIILVLLAVYLGFPKWINLRSNKVKITIYKADQLV